MGHKFMNLPKCFAGSLPEEPLTMSLNNRIMALLMSKPLDQERQWNVKSSSTDLCSSAWFHLCVSLLCSADVYVPYLFQKVICKFHFTLVNAPGQRKMESSIQSNVGVVRPGLGARGQALKQLFLLQKGSSRTSSVNCGFHLPHFSF